MADGYARATGKVGVCMATSGPGATNLVTGIATAMMDSVADGRDHRARSSATLIGKDAFQETDITGITLPITKHNFFVQDGATRSRRRSRRRSTSRAPAAPARCWWTSRRMSSSKRSTTSIRGGEHAAAIARRSCRTTARSGRAGEAAREAKKPIIMAGHGILIADAAAEVLRVGGEGQIPVVNTWLGLGSFPEIAPALARPAGHARPLRTSNRAVQTRRSADRHRHALR